MGDPPGLLRVEEAPAELANEALKMALARRNNPRDVCIIRIVRMLPAGFAATAKEPYPAVGIALQHPDPHSD